MPPIPPGMAAELARIEKGLPVQPGIDNPDKDSIISDNTVSNPEEIAKQSNREHSHKGIDSPKVRTDDLIRDVETRIRAYPAGNQDISHNTATKVTLGTESFDTRGEFASNKFTCVKEGYYLILANVYWAGGDADGAEFTVYIYKNGSSISQNSGCSTNSQPISNSVTDIVYLEPDDYIELYVKQQSGDTIATVGNTTQTFLSITKLFPK